MKIVYRLRGSFPTGVDIDAHTAAFMLDIAPKLDEAFPDRQASRIDPDLLAYLTLATQWCDGKHDAGIQKVLDPSESLATLKGNAQYLANVTRRLETELLQRRKRFGFGSPDGERLMSLVYSSSIKRGSSFTIDGIVYTLIKFHRKFEYHPGRKAPGRSPPS